MVVKSISLKLEQLNNNQNFDIYTYIYSILDTFNLYL